MEKVEVSENIKLALYAMLFKYKNLYLTGSLTLNALEVISRPSNDIDFCVYDQSVFDKIVEQERDNICNTEQSEVDDEQINNKKYIRLYLNGVGICIFNNSETEKGKTFKVDIGGVWLESVHPSISIDFKRKYVQHIVKSDNITEYNVLKAKNHIDDICKYHYWIEPKG